MQVRDLLVAAHVERADDDSLSVCACDDFAVDLKLLLFGRDLVHEEIFGAEETDSGGAGLADVVNVADVVDVGGEVDAVAVDGLRFKGAFLLQLVEELFFRDLFLRIKFERFGFRVGDDRADEAVDDDVVALREALAVRGEKVNFLPGTELDVHDLHVRLGGCLDLFFH